MLANIYNSIDPDILLLNETSNKNTDHLKIFNYNVFKTNKRNEQFAGAAIAIKKNITAQIEDYYYQDFISATIFKQNTAQSLLQLDTFHPDKHT